MPVAASATALDARTVQLDFTEALAADGVKAEDLAIFTPLRRPEESLSIERLEASGAIVILRTGPQRGGEVYAIQLGALRFEGIEAADAPTQVNFEGFGLAPVELTLDARGFVVPSALTLLVTLDPQTGGYTSDFRRLPLDDADGDGVFAATISARIDKIRRYAARVVTADGSEAAALAAFTVTSTAGTGVALEPRLDRLPEFEPLLDPTPGDGRAPVRIILDDRYARALSQPSLRMSLDAQGRFDLSLSRVEPARALPGKPRVFEVIVDAAVDPARRFDGMTAETFPYVTFLVLGGADVPERGGNFVMPEERSQVLVIPIGNPALVPVTFRVDAGAAILEPDLGLRGVYPGEGIFLTGELPNAEDALGRLAADAFTGGERSTLEMTERPDAPGIYEKTVFLPPGRPYGWKVVRCPSGAGCAELNRHVTSSGRAFPTVMKNLTTANTDAAHGMSVRLADPRSLDRVELEDGSTADYSRARVSVDGAEPPSTRVLFKQEAPDLVVTVGTEPVITSIPIVGTWRDVNIPERPIEIIQSGGQLSLAPYDYDDGMQGRPPLIRALELPLDPAVPAPRPGQPPFVPADGQRDASAVAFDAGSGRLPLFVAWNERELYVATAPATPGRDHFVMISLDPPGSTPRTQWAKAGTGAAGTRTVFLAMEGDGDFAGWFARGVLGTDDTPILAGVAVGRGAVLEGTIDLTTRGAAPTSIWIAVVAYGTLDGDPLDAAGQNPSGNADGNLDAAEMREVRLSDVRAP
ncbi:MAG: hypothetical protein IT384_31025 [Deltaproteobacteria bacterium]|nr:hypothetical protein [Deltaproteobacteria bacterium]